MSGFAVRLACGGLSMGCSIVKLLLCVADFEFCQECVLLIQD